MSNLWFFYSLGAAVMWGAGYVITEKVLKSGISPITALLLHGMVVIPIYLLLGTRHQAAIGELKLLWQDKTLLGLAILSSVMVVVGNLGLLKGVADKNAALVSLIEISYPLFVILFSYLFLKGFTISPAAIVGGVMIISGVFVVYYFGS